MSMYLAIMITVMCCFGFSGCAAILGATGLGSGKPVDLRFPKERRWQRYSHQLSEFHPQVSIPPVEATNLIVNFYLIQ